MRTNRLTILVIGLLFTSIFAATVSAQTVTVGVSKGETFDYSYSIIWTSTDPSATPPSDLVEYNNTQKFQFKINDISGPTLNVDVIRLFNNGSQKVESGTINVENGLVTVPYGFLIVGANLAKGQQVYPNGGHQTITDTVTRSYPNGQRETNVISGQDSEQKTVIYFDKIKGITVDYSYTIYETSGSYSIVSTEQLINTNSDVWTASTSIQTPTPTTPSSTSTPTNGGTNSPQGTSTVPSSDGARTPNASGDDITGTVLDAPSGILIAAIIAAVILAGLAVALVVFRKRRVRKVKEKPEENDFDLSCWGL